MFVNSMTLSGQHDIRSYMCKLGAYFRYRRDQHATIRDLKSSGEWCELLAQIVLQRPMHKPMLMIRESWFSEHDDDNINNESSPVAGTATIHQTDDLASTWDLDSYNHMTRDKVRVEFYRRAIQRVDDDDGCLEIGPGTGTLTQLLVESHHRFQPQLYTGVEVNKIACQAFKRRYPTLRLVEGFANSTDLRLAPTTYIDTVTDQQQIQRRHLLHELFGGIASCEGVVPIIQPFMKQGLYHSIPDAAATFLVPLAAEAKDIASLDAVILSKTMIKARLPFATTRLSIDDAILEWLDFRTPTSLQSGQHRLQRIHITKAGIVTAIGVYMWIGINTSAAAEVHSESKRSKDTSAPRITLSAWDSVTSNSEDARENRYCDHWSNYALVLRAPIDVEVGDWLELTTHVELLTNQPRYDISVKKSGSVDAPQRWTFGVGDLYEPALFMSTRRCLR